VAVRSAQHNTSTSYTFVLCFTGKPKRNVAFRKAQPRLLRLLLFLLRAGLFSGNGAARLCLRIAGRSHHSMTQPKPMRGVHSSM
jgi:hypothetical protein